MDTDERTYREGMSEKKLTWTAEEIRAMLIEMMDTDKENNAMLVNVGHLRHYFTERGIDMIGKTVTVYQ